MPATRSSVLLVDDVEANLVALEALLGDMNCDLVRASGGNEALKQLLKREFAVMLLDVQMPEIDGFEVAKYARQNQATRDVPIIFLTAMHFSEDSMLRGYGTGAVDFLMKPINAHVLRAKVRVFLELHDGRRKLANEVSAHKRTLDALELANTALRHFTNAASHDLRAPLRAMRGFMEALSTEIGPSLGAQAADYLTRSRRAGQRMDALLNSLLSYAGLQRMAEHVEVDCNALLEQVETDLAERLTTAKATLEVTALPTLKGDASRLYQLFLNLVGNATKFQAPGRPPIVTVSAVREGKEWVFCVEDNGIGIEAQYQAAVFDAFRRLHSESVYEGSGLGLTICQRIVEEHAGRIWLDSEPGHGSRFYFALPA